jgi:hypothetical protein
MLSSLGNVLGTATAAVARLFDDNTRRQFYDDYKDQTIIELRQIGQVVGLTSPGVCDVFVESWFRRIDANKLTWKDRSIKKGASTAAPNWTKKGARLTELNRNREAYGQKAKFGYTVPPPVGSDSSVYRELGSGLSTVQQAQAAALIGAIVNDGRDSSDAHRYYSLRIKLRSGSTEFGHMIGIHVPRVDCLPTESGSPAMPAGTFHFFDPNVGEFHVPKRGAAEQFLIGLLGIYGQRLVQYNLWQTDRWWRPRDGVSAANPYRYQGPAVSTREVDEGFEELVADADD